MLRSCTSRTAKCRDNIVKPILDAMCPEIYLDDRQVERVIVQKFEPARGVTFWAVSRTLADALDRERPVLYVRLDTAATAAKIW